MSKVTVTLSDGSQVVRDSADGDVNLPELYTRFGHGNVLVDGEVYWPPVEKPKKAKKSLGPEEAGEEKDDAPT